MRFYRLSNGEVINLENIDCITKPEREDPYGDAYGLQYSIIMSSGHVVKCYDSIKEEPRMSTPLYGCALLKYTELMSVIGISNLE
jgi:hypothetical protein